MTTDFHPADIHEVLARHQVRYEVRPYYVILDQRPAGAPPIEQKVLAGFDVDLYGVLEKEQLPLYHSEEGSTVLNYFESVAQEIQSNAGQHCTVEVIPCTDSLVLDTNQHFRAQATLRIRISHNRGLDQPEGPSEEQALEAIRETLRKLDVKES
jgi:hypothetical protein